MPPASLVLSLPVHPVSSGLDCYSHTWNLEIQGGSVAWLGWIERWGWFVLLSRWQHEIRDVTAAGTAEVRCSAAAAP